MKRQHYAPPSAIRASLEFGIPAVALCGLVWKPTGVKDPLGLICHGCADRRAVLLGPVI